MLTYVGKGYSRAFTDNYDSAVSRLCAGEDAVLVDGPDDICQPLLGDAEAHCRRQSVTDRDERAASAVAGLLGRPLRPGETISLDAAAIERMRDAFRARTTRDACAGCEWFDLCTAIAGDDFAGTRLHMR